MVAYADATQLLPKGLTYEQAAPIFCAGYTVYSGLRFADPRPHERVAVVGIGALGHLGIQYSKAAGFETIAVTYSKDKEELAYKLRADSVVANGEGLLKEGQHDSLGGGSSSGVDVLQVILTRQLQTQLKVLDQMDGRFFNGSLNRAFYNFSRDIIQTCPHHRFYTK